LKILINTTHNEVPPPFKVVRLISTDTVLWEMFVFVSVNYKLKTFR
jgi:hypothetical protein